MPDLNPTTAPAWVTDTPGDLKYQLCMFGDCCSLAGQSIMLTREEFLDLKQRLAELRGHLPKSVPLDVAEWELLLRARDALHDIAGMAPPCKSEAS